MKILEAVQFGAPNSEWFYNKCYEMKDIKHMMWTDGKIDEVHVLQVNFFKRSPIVLVMNIEDNSIDVIDGDYDEMLSDWYAEKVDTMFGAKYLHSYRSAEEVCHSFWGDFGKLMTLYYNCCCLEHDLFSAMM